MVRAGGGISYDRLPSSAGTALNPPTYELARFVNLTITPSLLANAYSALNGQPIPVSSTVIFHKDQNLKTAYSKYLPNNTTSRRNTGVSVPARSASR